MKGKLLGLGMTATLLCAASVSAGPIYGFERITSNGSVNVASQLTVEVTEGALNQAVFTFRNTGSAASFIADVYFDDGTLFGIASIDSSTGVAFTAPATPGDLPSGNSLNPDFQTTGNFSADFTGGAANGVDNWTGAPNGGEWLKITFNLINGKNYSDTLHALTLGGAVDGLRIGLHVQGIAPGDESDSFVNTVQVPDGGSVAMLLGVALIGLRTVRRR